MKAGSRNVAAVKAGDGRRYAGRYNALRGTTPTMLCTAARTGEQRHARACPAKAMAFKQRIDQ
jgi:hypothetical protein